MRDHGRDFSARPRSREAPIGRGDEIAPIPAPAVSRSRAIRAPAPASGRPESRRPPRAAIADLDCLPSATSRLFREPTEIEEYYPDAKYQRTCLMCAFASYYTNLGSAEPDKINRDEHFHRAESLLNQASLIRRNGAPGEKEEQLPVLGMAHLKMARGETAEAEKLIDAARNLKDDGAENVAPMLWKALFLFRRDQFGDALQWYRRALRAHPSAPATVRLGIGACQLRLGQFAEALKAFERALSLEPQNPDALLGAALAELHGASPNSTDDLEAGGGGDVAYDAAVERGLQYLERAFNVDPHNPATRVALAKHFLVADDGDAVSKLTETIVAGAGGGAVAATNRLRAEASFVRARAAHKSGDLAAARSLYQAAAQLDETFAAPAFGLAQVALARGDVKAAGVYAEKARAAFPESHSVVRVYGHLRRVEDDARSVAAGGGVVSVGKAGAGAGRDAETAAALRRAADADASDFEARLELGDALLGAGEYARASKAYERAAEIAPGDAPSAALLNNCGVLRAMTGRGAHEGRFEKARGWFLRALAAAHAESEGGVEQTGEALDVSSARAKTPESALPVAFNLARLVEDRGMVAEAERRYRDLLVASPKMTECLLRLASMRAERRDFEGATALAREALAADAEDTDAMAFLGHLLMKQGRWAEAQAQFKLLRAAHKPLGAQAAQLAAAAGKDPKAATHATDEYAMISVGNAAYYQAMKAQSAGNRNRAASDEKSSKAVKEHLEYAATMYTKALQKSESNLFAANGLGILLAEKGKIEEAKETFQMVAEGLRAAATNGDESSGDANGAARDRASKFPDIWINQGHIQMAKGNWDAAARHYAQAQAKFFHNLDPSVMLYQARNQYESGTSGLPESQKTLRRALHVAPWNHRLRFNLAYVIQEKAQREMQTLLKAGQKIAGGGVAEDGGTKAARLQTAIDEIALAGSIFDQLLTVAAAAEAGGETEGDDKDKEERKRRASAMLGFDKSRVRTHAGFCRQSLKDWPQNLPKARAEDEAFHAKRESLMAERRAEMEKLAMEKAKARADEELRRKAEEAAAAAARDKFKRSNEEYMARTAGEREAEAAAEGRRGKGGAAEYVDEDDDDVPAPDAELAKPKTAEEKAALKATGLFSDSEDEEEEAQDTDEEEEEAPDAEKSDAEKSDAESEEEDAPAATEDPAPSGRRARAKPEAEAEKSSKAKKAMEALAAKSRKKRGLEPAAEGAAAEEEAADPEPEAPSRKRRKALVDDDDE